MSSSSKSGSSGSKSYNYYGTIAAAWHVGQMDALTGIIVNDKLVWSGNLLRSSSTNPVDVTIPGYGTYHHYWGLETQTTTDSRLSSSGNSAGHQHPAYTGICYGVFDQILFGLEQTTVPSFSIRGNRAPVQSLITGGSALLFSNQANPFCVLAELFTNDRFGLGLSASLFSATKWQAAADAAFLHPELTYISPFYDTATSAISIAQDCLVLCDGFLRAETGTGLCEAGLFTSPDLIDVSSLTLIDSKSMIGVPDFKPDTWDDVQTTWNVKFRDRDYNFKARSLRYDDLGALEAVGEVRPQDLQRDNIVLSAQALAHGREWGRRNSLPGMTGTPTVRTEIIGNVRPGNHVKIDVQPEPGGTPIIEVFKVNEIVKTPKGSSKLTVDMVTSLSPATYQAGTTPTPPTPVTTPCITHSRIFELPQAINGDDYQVAVLAEQPNDLATYFAIQYDASMSGAYTQIGSTRAFGLRCAVVNAFTKDASGPFRINVLGTRGTEITQSNPDTSAAADDSVLLILFKIDSGTGQIKNDANGDAYMEIMSCESFTAVSGTQIDIAALRGRQGTQQRAFDPSDEVWIIRRKNLEPISHQQFPQLGAAGGDGYFVLEPGSATDQNTTCSPQHFKWPPNRDIPANVLTYDQLLEIVTPVSVTCYHREESGTYTLHGIGEYIVSSPPKKYLKETIGGTECVWDVVDVSSGGSGTTCAVAGGMIDNGSHRTWSGIQTCDPVTGVFTDARQVVQISATGGTLPQPAACPVSGSSATSAIGVTPFLPPGGALGTTFLLGAGTYVDAPFASTQYKRTYAGDCNTTVGSFTDYRKCQGAVNGLLENEDTDAAGLARAIGALPAITTLGWVPCMSVFPCGLSSWANRTTGFSASITIGQFRIAATGLALAGFCLIQVPIMKTDLVTSVTTLYMTQEFEFYADGAGSLDFIFDFPMIQGFSFTAQLPTFKNFAP